MCGKDGWAWLLKSCRRDTVIWRHTERHKGERDRVSQREDDWLMWSVRRHWSPGETPPQTPITPHWRECRLALMFWKQTGCSSNLGGGMKIRTAGAENRKQTVAGSQKFLASHFRCEKFLRSSEKKWYLPRVILQKALQTCHFQQSTMVFRQKKHYKHIVFMWSNSLQHSVILIKDMQYLKWLNQKVIFVEKINRLTSRNSQVKQLLYEPYLSQDGDHCLCVCVTLQRGLLIRYSSRKCLAILAVLSCWDLVPHWGSFTSKDALQAQPTHWQQV